MKTVNLFDLEVRFEEAAREIYKTRCNWCAAGVKYLNGTHAVTSMVSGVNTSCTAQTERRAFSDMREKLFVGDE